MTTDQIPTVISTREFMQGEREQERQRREHRMAAPPEKIIKLARIVRNAGVIQASPAIRAVGYQPRDRHNVLVSLGEWFPVYDDEDHRGRVVIGWNPDINYPGEPWV